LLKKKKKEEYEVAYINGEIHIQDGVPMLVEINNPSTSENLHPAVFVGEIKLSDLKQALSKAGFRTEISGGVLVCNQSVIITKDGDGANSKILIEGTLGDDYYKIRELLYSQFLIL